ncbi:MAG: hypothetical protein ACLFRI_06075 [Candidatus Izemoplasmataceae bacterium]
MEWTIFIEFLLKPLLLLIFIGIIIVYPKQIEALWQKDPIPENTLLSTLIDFLFIVPFSFLFLRKIIIEQTFVLGNVLYLLILAILLISLIKSTICKLVNPTQSTKVFRIYYGHLNVKDEIEAINQTNNHVTILMSASESPMSVKIIYSDQLSLKESLKRLRQNRALLPDLSSESYQKKLVTHSITWVFALIGLMLLILI